MLNSVVSAPPWQNVWAVAVLRPLDNHLTQMLNQHGYGVHVSGVVRCGNKGVHLHVM